ncbi:MAG: hypothetical protein QM723_38205 [Myxococcaceae bacterium]
MSVAVDLGRAFLEACLALGDDSRTRVLAASVDPESLVLDWNGTWRFCQGGLHRTAPWPLPSNRELVPTVAAMLIRYALAGDSPHDLQMHSSAPRPLWDLVERYVSHPIATRTAAEMRTELEALRLDAPSPAEWRKTVLEEHFRGDCALEELESQRIRGLITTILPEVIDRRLLLDDSNEAYLVAADWLMTNKPRRGALAEVQRLIALAAGPELERLKDRERDLFRQYVELSPEPVLEQSWLWREGWIDALVVRQPLELADHLERTLLHPAARYLRSLEVAGHVGGNPRVVEALERVRPRSLRRVHLSAGGQSLVERVRAAMPWLSDLVGSDREDNGNQWLSVGRWP